jgi:type II secretory pathway pseudopilin PulG
MNNGKNRYRTCAVRQEGFTYLTALFLVAVVGLGLALTGEFWSHSRQREKEAELIWIGNQFTQAIGLYYQRSPGAVKRYPEKLEDLLEDKRYLSMQRYLRKIYADPISGKPAWGLVAAPGGGIMGVHSTAEGKPVRTAPLVRDEKSTAGANSYRDWRFVYEPATAAQAPTTKPATANR